MKKIILPSLLIIAMLCTASHSYAQFKKGQILLNGSISFNNINNQQTQIPIYGGNNGSDSTKNSNFYFNPSVAKFTSDNIMYGIGVNYYINSQNSTSASTFEILSQKTNQQSIGIRFYTRHYLPLGKNFYVFFQASVAPSYIFNKTIYTDISLDQSFNSIDTTINNNGFDAGASFTAGLSYKLTQRLLIDVTLPSIVNIDYQHVTVNTINTTGTNNSFDISTGLTSSALSNIGLGVSFLLYK